MGGMDWSNNQDRYSLNNSDTASSMMLGNTEGPPGGMKPNTKKLPAWIRQGLEKMEQEKMKKQMKEEEEKEKAALAEEQARKRQQEGKSKFDSDDDEKDGE